MIRGIRCALMQRSLKRATISVDRHRTERMLSSLRWLQVYGVFERSSRVKGCSRRCARANNEFADNIRVRNIIYSSL